MLRYIMNPTCISQNEVLLLCIQGTYQISALFSQTGQYFLLTLKEYQPQLIKEIKLRATVSISYHPKPLLCHGSQKMLS